MLSYRHDFTCTLGCELSKINLLEHKQWDYSEIQSDNPDGYYAPSKNSEYGLVGCPG